MKIRCNNCGKVFLGDVNSTCPKCFAILSGEDDFEVLEDEQIRVAADGEPKEEITLTEDAKSQTKRILECVFWLVFCFAVILSVVFTSVNLSNGGSGDMNALNSFVSAYKTGEVSDYLEILPEEYLDYKGDDFSEKLQKKLNEQIASYSSGVGKDYKVEYKVVSKSDYTKDDITMQKNLLPYKIEREVKNMKSAQILLTFKGEKSFSYRKTLLLGQIENKWYLLNADNQ